MPARGWPVKDDQLTSSAIVAADRTNLVVNASNQPGRRLLAAEPNAVGDPLAICIPEPATFTGELAYQGRTVVAQGLISGTFCGQGR